MKAHELQHINLLKHCLLQG